MRLRIGFLGLLVIVLSVIVLLAPARASSGTWYCTVQPGQNCVGGFNNWNGHNVSNLGGSSMFCGAYQPNGTQQGYAWVSPGETKHISAWLYNRIICTNATAQTTLQIYSYI